MARSELRRGIYFIADTGVLADERLAPVTEAALRGGVTLVQLRAKDRTEEDVARLGTELLTVARDFGVPLLVNDLPELAADIGAEGVHVGQEDMAVRDAREMLGPRAIIGATAKTPEQVRRAEAEGADYVAVGAMFPSPTKPHEPTMPLQTARQLGDLTQLPLCVIGGINQGNIAELAGVGIDLVCVISAVALAEDPEDAARALREAMEAWPSQATTPRR